MGRYYSQGLKVWCFGFVGKKMFGLELGQCHHPLVKKYCFRVTLCVFFSGFLR